MDVGVDVTIDAITSGNILLGILNTYNNSPEEYELQTRHVKFNI